MSYFLANEDGPIESFASISALEEFAAWSESQGDPLRAWVESGYVEGESAIRALALSAKQAHPSSPLVAEMLGILVKAASKTRLVLILSDGA